MVFQRHARDGRALEHPLGMLPVDSLEKRKNIFFETCQIFFFFVKKKKKDITTFTRTCFDVTFLFSAA